MIITLSSTFTRPNDIAAYAVGDMVANSTVAGEVVPAQFSVARLSSGRGAFRSIKLWKSSPAAAVDDFSVFVFAAPPEILSGDNAPLLIRSAEHFVGGSEVNLQSQTFAGQDDAAGIVTVNWSPFDLGTERYLYAVLQADAAYVPVANEQFTITLGVEG